MFEHGNFRLLDFLSSVAEHQLGFSNISDVCLQTIRRVAVSEIWVVLAGFVQPKVHLDDLGTARHGQRAGHEIAGMIRQTAIHRWIASAREPRSEHAQVETLWRRWIGGGALQ